MGRPRVVIVGGGFGGYEAAKRLRRAPVDITLVDRTNHFLFQPLLYQVATATLAPTDITIPIRYVLRRQRNVEVLLGAVTAIDTQRRVVVLDNGQTELPYDYLIIATGARHSYFSHPEWEATAPGLKSIEDALDVRNRFLLSFEEAERCDNAEERRAYQRFVVVGGGPTGVELAGMLPDVAASVHRDYRRIDTRAIRVVLLEGGARILPAFRYVNKGDLATIGRYRAIADFGFITVVGYPAWLLWLFVHILYLAGFRNRLSVLVQWAYAYFTYHRGMRLITNTAREVDGTSAVGGHYTGLVGALTEAARLPAKTAMGA